MHLRSLRWSISPLGYIRPPPSLGAPQSSVSSTATPVIAFELHIILFFVIIAFCARQIGIKISSHWNRGRTKKGDERATGFIVFRGSITGSKVSISLRILHSQAYRVKLRRDTAKWMEIKQSIIRKSNEHSNQKLSDVLSNSTNDYLTSTWSVISVLKQL